MLEYITQNALLIAIILLLLVTNVWYFFELESKKGRIECDETYINTMEERVIQAHNELWDLRRERINNFMQKPNPREIVAYDCQFKINNVVNYKGNNYQVSKAEYLEDPQTKIERLHYHLTDELGNVIIRSHDSMTKVTYHVYEKK